MADTTPQAAESSVGEQQKQSGGSHQPPASKPSCSKCVQQKRDQQIDRCVADGITKVGTGFALGALFSLLLFKRRSWPIFFGVGMGVGSTLTNYSHDLRTPNSLISNRIVALPKRGGAEVASS